MPLTSDLVGRDAPAVEADVDSRWLMAYAASIGSVGSVYLDTRRPGGVVGHPLFPVCLEWPAVLAVRQLLGDDRLSRDESARGVHISHDLRGFRPVRAGDHLATTATVIGVERHRAGGLVTLELRTTDPTGATVCLSHMGTLYREVAIDGPDRPAPDGGPPASGEGEAGAERWVTVETLDVPANAAHVYTEGSRIWNPIHTDARTAERAGLPGIILHGTATLAMAVSGVVTHRAAGDPAAVTRVRGRFGAMVTLPSRLALRIGPAVGLADGATVVAFEVGGPAPTPVLHSATVELGIAAPPP